MNLWLLGAGVAALLLDLVHVIFGGRDNHQPMLASAMPTAERATWSVCWHGITAVMLFGGLGLIAAGLVPDQAVALSVVPLALFAAMTVLFIGYSLTRLRSVFGLPQWTAFLVITVVGVIGLL